MIYSFAQEAAESQGRSGNFREMLKWCERVWESNLNEPDTYLQIGDILFRYGFLAHARDFFERVLGLSPKDLRARIGLASLAHEAGEHAQASRLYAALCKVQPDNPVFRRNALLNLEYNPVISDSDRFTQAKVWGEWATMQAGGPYSRPTFQERGESLRLGYVSADFCQHTAGLFIKEVIKAHDPEKVAVFAYSAGSVKDGVTAEIQNASRFRDVANLNDIALSNLIRQDEIDVLVDLSGHTAGSRLTVFARRPAPVQVSWLGYFATTGLPSMDAVLLDQYHAPPGTESNFVEKIIRLSQGRFCYQPVPFAPDVTSPPCIERGYVTFGSFNNTSKYNEGVFDLWARVLLSVPSSRLILKWRTFNDEALSQSVLEAFARRDIDPSRIELRGPSFHAEMLKEYSDIDIALDPFPFTGGMTSCEALWMGVPVLTMPMSRVVSRQTFSILSVIGLPELAAKDVEDHIRLVTELANDPERLMELRSRMRERMQASPLMNVKEFTRNLEQVLLNLADEISTDHDPLSPV